MPVISRTLATRKYKRRVGLRQFRKTYRKQSGFNTNMDKIIYPYRQYCDTALLTNAGITTQVAVDSRFAWQFTLNMLPQVATFTSLYDVYRISKIEFTIRPRAVIHQILGGGQGTVGLPAYNNFIYAVDNDDANVPASYNELREYGNAKEIQLLQGRKHVITFKPAVAQIIYNNGITTANGERFSPWIDVANPAVPHYGIKIALPPTTSANQITCDITVRYLLEFKQVR